MSTGSCLCGAIRYQVTGPLRPVVACHCAQCRKSSGHFVAATSAPRDSVSIRGAVTWYVSSSQARRGFCGRCGSRLFWDGPGANLSIHAGSLDQADNLALKGHIFCADKGGYYDISDDLPCADGADPDLTTQVI